MTQSSEEEHFAMATTSRSLSDGEWGLGFWRRGGEMGGGGEFGLDSLRSGRWEADAMNAWEIYRRIEARRRRRGEGRGEVSCGDANGAPGTRRWRCGPRASVGKVGAVP